MARSYYNNKSASEESFKEGYFYPGDIGNLDINGHLHLQGRSQDVINLNGIKYNPENLEQIVQAQLGIIDCAAFSRESEDGAQLLALALVTDEDFDLQRFGEVMAKKLPVKIDDLFKLDFIPRNENGKIERSLLSQTYSSEKP